VSTHDEIAWHRRAQPLLGTLVEVGVHADQASAATAAFTALREAQACLSRFEPGSDIARFNRLRRGGHLRLKPITRHVLAAALDLKTVTRGLFDISLGSGPDAWALCDDALRKLAGDVQLDLGGIGKGHAVDLAVQALVAQGATAGWVNAGGDLRAFGDVEVPVRLRDEATGGVRAFATLRDGAFATSHFGTGSRSALANGNATAARRTHLSVAAPLCLWADALTKVVALGADPAHPLLGRFGAHAWLH